MLNKQGPGKIDWTDWTFNPISGCLYGCEYCYMKRMEKRFPGIMRPKFHPEYLEKFKRMRKAKAGDKIFVGSSGDMWGYWAKTAWISEVLAEIFSYKQFTFQFLTKNPSAYRDWYLEDYTHCWFGTTVDGRHKTRRNLMDLAFALPDNLVKFVSFEPLLSPVNVSHTEWQNIDWVIIGADSNPGAAKPPNEWARTLINGARDYGVPIWVKDNYGYPETIKQFPKIKGTNNGCQKTENKK